MPQLALMGEQNLSVQRLREVLCLYLNGKDRHWLETTTQITFAIPNHF